MATDPKKPRALALGSITSCSICRAPCAGSADTSNPFCIDCLTLSFSGNALERWQDHDTPLPLSRRQQAQLARLLDNGGGVAEDTAWH